MTEGFLPEPILGEDEATRRTIAVGRLTGWLGSFPAILISIGLVLLWAAQGILEWILTGHSFLDSTYQLEINTTTTIITFWMCFIIQNTQNRDGRAVQTKLDAICEHLGLDPKLIGLEDATETAIEEEQRTIRSEMRAQTQTLDGR